MRNKIEHLGIDLITNNSQKMLMVIKIIFLSQFGQNINFVLLKRTYTLYLCSSKEQSNHVKTIEVCRKRDAMSNIKINAALSEDVM